MLDHLCIAIQSAVVPDKIIYAYGGGETPPHPPDNNNENLGGQAPPDPPNNNRSKIQAPTGLDLFTGTEQGDGVILDPSPCSNRYANAHVTKKEANVSWGGSRHPASFFNIGNS